jgi:hypothetical protein
MHEKFNSEKRKGGENLGDQEVAGRIYIYIYILK